MACSKLLALAVNRVAFLRPREKKCLLEACETPARFGGMSTAALAAIVGRPVRSGSWQPLELLRQAERELRDLTLAGFVCTFYWERTFPSLLKEIYDPPVVLYHRGALPEPTRSLVAIVGTRRPSGAARERAYELGFELGRAGIATVSGLARGIDAEAHRGTLEAGGYSIGILGSGIDLVCPSSSRALARRMLTQGSALASDYPPGTPPEAHNFPARNRIISGMARTVVVVQAPERSGALITAEYALEQGRDLAVHAVGLCGQVGAGTRALWQQGAPVVRTAADVLKLWGVEPPSEAPQLFGDGAPATTAATRSSREWGRVLARQMEQELAGEIAVRGRKVFHKSSPWRTMTRRR
jgi:DNA processing protein